jgi:hypothetical protein
MASTARLLQYPPEIRNMIYETLFQLEDAIELEFDPAHRRLNSLVPCVALLATCRQIWEEASGFLYSRNTFLYVWDLEYYFKVWIKRIGDNLALLRGIHINLGWDEDDYRHCELDVEFILRELWRQPTPRIEFSIWKETDAQTKTRVLVLEPNNILQALRPGVSPHLKPLVYAQHSVRCILMGTSGRHVRFVFRSTDKHGSIYDPEIEYDLSVDGELRRTPSKFPPPPLPNLMGILRLNDAYLAFRDFIRVPSKSMTFDLDSHTVSTGWPSIIHVNQSLRENYLPLFWTTPLVNGWKQQKEVDFTVRMMSHESRTTFNGFMALKSWIASGYPTSLVHDDEVRICEYKRPCKIILSFQIGGHSPRLEDLRLEITELVFATFSLSLETTICIQYFQVQDSGQIALVGKAFSTLYRLRRALLVSLADILSAQPRRHHGLCPQVWADGFFRLREAEFDLEYDGTGLVVENQKWNWTPSNLNKEKDAIIRRLAPGSINLRWGHMNSEELRRGWVWDSKDDVTAGYETLYTFATFLAQFVKTRIHPEILRQGNRWRQEWKDRSNELEMAHTAPWHLLRELRPRI